MFQKVATFVSRLGARSRWNVFAGFGCTAVVGGGVGFAACREENIVANQRVIQGKVLITGAASGLGRLMALEVAKRGGTVVAWDINRANMDQLLLELRKLTPGRDHYGYLVDVSSREKIYEAAEQVKNDVGNINVLINNAGIVAGKPFMELPDEKIEMVMKINTLGMFWTTKAFLPAMIAENRGHVVAMASAAGLIGVSGLADYSASKFAVVGFNESLRFELAKIAPGVRTTVVCPFYINTGLFKGVQTRFPHLLPVLEAEYVAKRVIEAIELQEERVVMPRIVNLIDLGRVLPVSMFDAIAKFMGVNQSMDTFVGRAS